MSSRRVERYEVVVIGGGQAGLAAGHWLAQRDIDFVILDAHSRVGDAWRRRWDSLRLFTPARYSALPGLTFPGDPYHLPTKDEVADYLEWYAQVFDLPVRNGVRVPRLERMASRYLIRTNGITYEADNVVVATGPFHTPSVPSFAAALDPAIVQLHSSQYVNPRQLPDGDTLVVGAANSGAQIAMELSATRKVMLAGPSVGSIPRRVLGRDIFDWIWPIVRRRPPKANALSSTDALIGMTERDIARHGIRRTARVTGVRDGKPVLDDGTTADVGSILWSSGFRPDFSWIDIDIFDERGYPAHKAGVVDKCPGLFFLGLRYLSHRTSSLIGGVGDDARRVTDAIVARYGSTRTSSAMSAV
jgi:putative flavoprotein involved in K+ transport